MPSNYVSFPFNPIYIKQNISVFSALHKKGVLSLPHPTSSLMAAQKVVLKVLTMTDEKTKQKAIEAAADILGVDSIAADLSSQKLTVIGEMDAVAVVKKLKKVGKVDILSVGPAKEDKKEEKKPEEKKEEKKPEEKKPEEKKPEEKKPEEKKPEEKK
ncbi:heavy metal-associated isoprenylated plant protein 39 [Salvia hispanica]|uniref:heavy metal-associated isoprenylated plant protein 39 n=1 Tax=Salvia hispanica TaxID=49212 RepID=UPI00200973E9|nr:heavy metal-associated isoprenylated plant protein 39 [Salvia hispanica]